MRVEDSLNGQERGDDTGRSGECMDVDGTTDGSCKKEGWVGVAIHCLPQLPIQ